MQVQVDGVPDAVEVDVLVHVEARVEEGAERAQGALVEREAVGGAEGVVDEAVDVDGPEADAAHAGVAAHVVEVVDRDGAGERAVEQAHPARDGVGGRLRTAAGDAAEAPAAPPPTPSSARTRKATCQGSTASPAANAPDRAAPQLGEQRPQLVDDEVLRDLLVVDAEHRQQVLLVAEVAERPVAEVVEQAGQPQGLFDQRLRRRAGLDLGQRGVHLPRQLAGEMHGAQTVREAAVLGGGEHPPRALQLVDALEALHPRVVDDVGLGDLAGSRQRDAQVAVQRVGDEVDVVVGQLHPPHPTAGPGRRQGGGARGSGRTRGAARVTGAGTSV